MSASFDVYIYVYMYICIYMFIMLSSIICKDLLNYLKKNVVVFHSTFFSSFYLFLSFHWLVYKCRSETGNLPGIALTKERGRCQHKRKYCLERVVCVRVCVFVSVFVSVYVCFYVSVSLCLCVAASLRLCHSVTIRVWPPPPHPAHVSLCTLFTVTLTTPWMVGETNLPTRTYFFDNVN